MIKEVLVERENENFVKSKKSLNYWFHSRIDDLISNLEIDAFYSFKDFVIELSAILEVFRKYKRLELRREI